ncbi:MAG: neutral/alkaline non-lysosomal ceramidase N-terminal domain-containing protein [Victivallales bacterium]|nr:neutral/alkaline non-lysosomal ceramidase N-terminal domain-containing protein [Victivallales bacterium]
MKIGFAVGDITPEAGLFLTGYGNPERIATGVHSPLCASAMVMGDGSRLAAVVALDWCTFDDGMAWDIRKGVEAVSGIKAEDIILCCTHTHSAPHTRKAAMAGRSACDPEQKGITYAYDSCKVIAEAVNEAKSSMRECAAGFGKVKTETGVSRRGTDRNGKVSGFIEDPYQMHDDNMTVVHFKDAEDGKDLGILVHCSAHNTTMGQNREYSSDWCGVMRERVRVRYGVPVVFVNGAVGDSGPRTNTWRNYAHISGYSAGGGDGAAAACEVGYRAASDALRCLEGIWDFRSDLPFAVRHNELRLPQALPMTEEEATGIVREYESANPVIPSEPDRMYQVAKATLAALRRPPEPELVTMQTLISFGPLVFLPFPFEMFSMFSLRLRKYSGFEYPLLCSIANGYFGYLPDKAAFAMGGYEVDWLCFARNYVVARNAGDIAVTQTLEALER